MGDRGTGRFFAHPLTRVALVAIVYLVGARAGLAVAFENRNVTAVWPPTGIAIAALLVWGLNVWPGIAIGAFFANLSNHAGLETSAAIVVGNTLAPVVGAYILRRASWFDTTLERMRDVTSLFLVGGFGAMLISATLGTAALVLTGAAASSKALSVWVVWWVGDAIGVVLFAPLLILLPQLAGRSKVVARPREMTLLVAFAVAIGLTVFGVHVPLAYLILVPVVWGALSFEQAGAALVTVVLAVLAVAETVNRFGPFASGTPTQNLVSLQLFNAILAFAGLSLASVVTARRHAEDALRTSEERYRRLFEQATDPIWIHDVDGNITYANDAMSRMTSLPVSRLSSMSMSELVGAEQEAVVRRAVRQLLDVGGTTSYEVEFRGSSGRLVALEVAAALVGTDGPPTTVQSIGRDVTSRNIAEGQLRRGALRDPVTGLANRTLLIERIEYALAIADQTQGDVALFVLDIDGLRAINEREGRGGGDILLRTVAHRLETIVRSTDTVARIGGDEFAVLATPVGDVHEAHAMALRMASEIKVCAPLEPTVAIGVSTRGGEAIDVSTLLRRADVAMRFAKRLGPGSIEVYSPELEPESGSDVRTELERSLDI